MGCRRRAGFTLAGIAVGIGVLGLATVVLLEVRAADARTHAQRQQAITGEALAASIRRMTVRLSVQQVRDLSGTCFSPPVDAAGAVQAGLETWSQRIEVEPVDPTLIAETVTPSASTTAYRVTATARHLGTPVSTLQWVVMEGR